MGCFNSNTTEGEKSGTNDMAAALPKLTAKLNELIARRDSQTPRVIAKGNYCSNPCYEFNLNLVNECPKCKGIGSVVVDYKECDACGGTGYEDDLFEVFLVFNPRSIGHTAISTKKHFKDMMEVDDITCNKIFILAKKVMNIIKNVYGCESVYLCTMCDGPMNHFHLQLIPRYDYEERGSKNFVKERKEYINDYEKINLLRNKIKEGN